MSQERQIVSDRFINEFIDYDSKHLLEEYSLDPDSELRRLNVNTKYQNELDPRHKKLLMMSCCFCYFSMGLSYGALGPSLEYFETSFANESEKVRGWLLTARGIGWIIGSFIAGPLYERVRGNRLLWISLVLTFIFCAITPVIPNLWVLVLIHAFQGAFMSWIEVGVNTLTVWIWKDKVSPFMQLLHFAFGLGLSSFPMIAAITSFASGDDEKELSDLRKSTHISYWLASGIVALTAIFPLMLKSPPIEKGLAEAHHLQQRNNRAVDRDPTAPRIVQKARYYVVVSCVTCFLLLYGGAENAFGSWAVTYAEDVYGMKKGQADSLDSLFWMAITFGRLLSVPIATRLSAKVLLSIDLGGSIGCLVILLLVTKFQIEGLLWACTITLGLFMASIYGAAFTVPAELKVKLSGKATSAFIVAAGIGDVAIPPLIDLINYPNALVWTLIGLLTMCGILFATSFTFGITTMEKRLDEMELEELSKLDDHWSFSFTRPLLNSSSLDSNDMITPVLDNRS